MGPNWDCNLLCSNCIFSFTHLVFGWTASPGMITSPASEDMAGHSPLMKGWRGKSWREGTSRKPSHSGHRIRREPIIKPEPCSEWMFSSIRLRGGKGYISVGGYPETYTFYLYPARFPQFPLHFKSEGEKFLHYPDVGQEVLGDPGGGKGGFPLG